MPFPKDDNSMPVQHYREYRTIMLSTQSNTATSWPVAPLRSGSPTSSVIKVFLLQQPPIELMMLTWLACQNRSLLSAGAILNQSC